MGTTERNPGGGVLGFAIAFLAFALGGAFGGAFGLPPWVRLLVIGVGVLLAVFSAGTTGFGLAAVVLGGIVLVSSLSLFGALGASPDMQVTPRMPTGDDATAPLALPVVVSKVDIPAGTDLNELIKDDQFMIIKMPTTAVVHGAVTSVGQLRDGRNGVAILAGEQIPARRIEWRERDGSG